MNMKFDTHSAHDMMEDAKRLINTEGSRPKPTNKKIIAWLDGASAKFNAAGDKSSSAKCNKMAARVAAEIGDTQKAANLWKSAYENYAYCGNSIEAAEAVNEAARLVSDKGKKRKLLICCADMHVETAHDSRFAEDRRRHFEEAAKISGHVGSERKARGNNLAAQFAKNKY
ncbi:MAG: hypothetical protein LBR91_01510 [Puniceicoccales bacterium]|jgi:hypothetical protein|nr:hypothetical protein [Puniceicoccales bacterium]